MRKLYEAVHTGVSSFVLINIDQLAPGEVGEVVDVLCASPLRLDIRVCPPDSKSEAPIGHIHARSRPSSAAEVRDLFQYLDRNGYQWLYEWQKSEEE